MSVSYRRFVVVGVSCGYLLGMAACLPYTRFKPEELEQLVTRLDLVGRSEADVISLVKGLHLPEGVDVSCAGSDRSSPWVSCTFGNAARTWMNTWHLQLDVQVDEQKRARSFKVDWVADNPL